MESNLKEHEVENYLVGKIKSMGGLCPKFVSPGLRGVPDRIIMFKGNTWFVETKRPKGGVLRVQQNFRAHQFRETGQVVLTAYTKSEVDEICEKLLCIINPEIIK